MKAPKHSPQGPSCGCWYHQQTLLADICDCDVTFTIPQYSTQPVTLRPPTVY